MSHSYYRCPHCNQPLYYEDQYYFCKECALKFDDYEIEPDKDETLEEEYEIIPIEEYKKQEINKILSEIDGMCPNLFFGRLTVPQINTPLISLDAPIYPKTKEEEKELYQKTIQNSTFEFERSEMEKCPTCGFYKTHCQCKKRSHRSLKQKIKKYIMKKYSILLYKLSHFIRKHLVNLLKKLSQNLTAYSNKCYDKSLKTYEQYGGIF